MSLRNRATWCPLQHSCDNVKTGKCEMIHRGCPDKSNCDALRRRQCSYYHPPRDHAMFESNSDVSSYGPPRDGADWTESETRANKKYINSNPNDPKSQKFIEDFAKKWNRKQNAVRQRVAKVIRDNKKQQELAQQRLSSDDSSDSSESSDESTSSSSDNASNLHSADNSNIIRSDEIMHVLHILEQIQLHYEFQNNQFEF